MKGQVKGIDTIFFTNKADIPADFWKDVKYRRIVVSYRTEKSDPNFSRLTLGGNRVNYPVDCKTPTTYLLTFKLLLNRTISTPGARFMTINIKDFYLMTPMDRYEYIRLKLANLPEDEIQKYTLWYTATKDGYVYLKIRQEMYGLPQAGFLAQKQL